MNKFIISLIIVSSSLYFFAYSANACIFSGENVFECLQRCKDSGGDIAYAGCTVGVVNPFANEK